MEELDKKTYSIVQKISNQGDYFAEKGDFLRAISEYEKALELIPKPQTNWEASTWLFAAIADANFFQKDFNKGVEYLNKAMLCPNAIGNPFLHLRLGQCYFETELLDKAADELTKAYAIEGEDIFSEENPKYFDFLKTKINIEKPKKRPWWNFWEM